MNFLPPHPLLCISGTPEQRREGEGGKAENDFEERGVSIIFLLCPTDSVRVIEPRGLAAGRGATTTGEKVTITLGMQSRTKFHFWVFVSVCARA